MRELFKKYKSVVRFILTFLSVYIVLSLTYKLYLDFSDGSKYYPDYITNMVAKQSEDLLNVFGYESQAIPHDSEPTMKLFVNSKYVARVIEGCNSVSVIILFMSFIIAFAGRKHTTIMYVLAGSVLIYVVNLLRIVILSIGLYHYPWRREILHTVIFPLIIYGMVFLLWMFWVNRFSHISQKNE
ncbi:MAG: exosortase family protein XrtF [Flavobacteriaceae bacterium]|nr:exosortase family protein XrtF [Flavobacteriaceae bacterium]